MDKQTLSNYGWIVICILVLSVMIALATPFGSFIANGVKSTTQGLFDVSQKSFNNVGFGQIADQKFEDMLNGKSVYYGDIDMDGDIDQDDVNMVNDYVLENCTLTNEQLRKADVNGDCNIDASDSGLINTYLLGRIDKFPVEDMPYYYGDVDMDGDIDEDDYNLVSQYYLEEEGYDLSEEQLKRADVNADGEVEYQDATMIRGYIRGIHAFFPAGR